MLHHFPSTQCARFNTRQTFLPMVNFTILAGGWTPFVVSYLFNSDTNSLTVLNQSPTGGNTSWISFHPTNKSIM